MTRRLARRRAEKVRLDGVKHLTDEELKNLTFELGRALNAANAAAAKLRNRLDAVKLERERRETMTSAGIHISEHAVVRYLERFRGIDMQAVREEIAAMAVAAGRVRTGRYGVRSGEDGIAFGVNEDDQTVTTVFREAEVPLMDEGDAR